MFVTIGDPQFGKFDWKLITGSTSHSLSEPLEILDNTAPDPVINLVEKLSKPQEASMAFMFVGSGLDRIKEFLVQLESAPDNKVLAKIEHIDDKGTSALVQLHFLGMPDKLEKERTWLLKTAAKKIVLDKGKFRLEIP